MMKLVEAALSGGAQRSLDEIRNDSLKLLGEVVGDLDAGNISEGAFPSSRAVWQIAYDLMRDDLSVPGIFRVPPGPGACKNAAPPPNPVLLPEFRTDGPEDESGTLKQKPWSMWRDG